MSLCNWHRGLRCNRPVIAELPGSRYSPVCFLHAKEAKLACYVLRYFVINYLPLELLL